jgi:hypothetical protein
MILLHLKSYILCFLLLTKKPLVKQLLKAFLFLSRIGDRQITCTNIKVFRIQTKNYFYFLLGQCVQLFV